MRNQPASPELTLDVRELRLEASHVVGSDPSLCYLALYGTTQAGQWSLLYDWDFGPFEAPETRMEALRSVRRAVSKLLG